MRGSSTLPTGQRPVQGACPMQPAWPTRRIAVTLRAAKKAQLMVEADLGRLYTDPEYQAHRTIGPVEIRATPGVGRSVHALRELATGELLLSCPPVGSVLTDPGLAPLRPEQLATHLEARGISAADRYRLGLLCDGSPASQKRATSWKELGATQAAAKASKQASAAKGFGAAAPAASSAAAAPEGPLSGEQLLSVLRLNAWGVDYGDVGVAALRGRGQPQASAIGVWPEFSLVNHSCAPNTCTLLVGQQLLVRAAGPVPEGGEVTTSYLATAGGLPLARRRAALSAAYGFTCGCLRCQAEAAAPAQVQQQLEAAHAWAEGGARAAAFAAHSAGDKEELQCLAEAGQELLRPLEASLRGMADLGEAGRTALRAGAFEAYQAYYAARDTLEGHTEPAYPQDLSAMLQVFAPGSEPHLLLAQEVPQRMAVARGQDSPQTLDMLRVMMAAYVQRYGRITHGLLTGMVEARSRVARYMGLVDVASVAAAAAAGDGLSGGAGAAEAEAPPQPRKATMAQLQSLMEQ